MLGTGLALIVNTLAAYALSKETRVFRARNVYLWYFVITMLFRGPYSGVYPHSETGPDEHAVGTHSARSGGGVQHYSIAEFLPHGAERSGGGRIYRWGRSFPVVCENLSARVRSGYCYRVLVHDGGALECIFRRDHLHS